VKILHLTYDDVSNPWLGGGGAVRTFEVYRRLASRHEVTVITGSFPGARDQSIEGIQYRRVGYGSRGYFLSRITYALAASRLVRKLDYDIVVEDFSAFSPCLSPLHTDKPAVAVLHNLYEGHTVRKYSLLGIVPYFSEKRGLKLYEKFIVVSPSLQQRLLQLGEESRNVVFIPNAVDDSLFRVEGKAGNCILFLGRIEKYQKGLDTLLTAFREVADKMPGTEMVIAGGGKDERWLMQELADVHSETAVRYVGPVFGEAKTELLSCCLFVCMPSRFEGWPLVAMEAAACGKPVVGTKVPGLWDAVKDGETGLLVESEDVTGLARAMLTLLVDGRLRDRLGDNARKWARSFS